MNFNELKEVVNGILADIDFEYQGKRGSICPLSSNRIEVCLGSATKTYTRLEDVFTDVFWNGKRLEDACCSFAPV